MASAIGSLWDMPGVSDTVTTDPHDEANLVQASTSTSAPTSVIKVAWAIIMLSLIGLWVMGYTFR